MLSLLFPLLIAGCYSPRGDLDINYIDIAAGINCYAYMPDLVSYNNRLFIHEYNKNYQYSQAIPQGTLLKYGTYLTSIYVYENSVFIDQKLYLIKILNNPYNGVDCEELNGDAEKFLNHHTPINLNL